MEELAGAGRGRMSLQKFVIEQDTSKRQKKAILEANKDTDTTSGSDPQESSNEQDDQVRTNDKTPKSEEQSSTPTIPAGLKQEYVFMPSRVRDAVFIDNDSHSHAKWWSPSQKRQSVRWSKERTTRG
jgi:hypothetical protein